MPDDLPTTDPRPSSRLVPIVALVALVLSIGGLLFWALSSPERGARRRVIGVAGASGYSVGDPYIGSTSCAECHPGEHALFGNSGHSRTLRPIHKTPFLTSLDGRTVADPERPGTSWSYRRDGDVLTVDRRQGEVSTSYDIDYALGSGRNASTLVSILDPTPGAFRLLEHRLTHYRDGDVLKLTPGHGSDAPPDPALKPYGRTVSTEESFRCFNCHTTRTSNAGPDTPVVVSQMTPNVSCERCHGPGRAHVQAAKKGASADLLEMPFGGNRETAAQQMEMCGKCHHHPDRAFAGEIDVRNPSLVRFQPVGLMQSKCYTKTPGNLSCTACHDPHDKPGKVAAKYEAVCLSCHATQHVSACKVNAKDRCVSCHMPKTPTAQDIPFSDHWIRIFREGDPAPPRVKGRFVPPGEPKR